MKILLVDGGPGVAEALAQSLQTLGWPGVGAATNSDEAVEWINREGGCDVLVTEVFLQPADGFTLRETIQPHLPEMKTIFTSIYDASAYTERMAGREFLQAPLTHGVLDAALRKLTSASPAAIPVPSASPQPTPVAASPRPTPVAASPQPTPVAASPQPTPVAASPQPTPVAASPRPTPVAASPAQPAPKASAKTGAQPLSVHATAVPVKASAPTPVAASPRPAASRASTASTLGSEIELPPDALVGKTIVNYHVEARIGKGPLGPVYRARQTNIERLVRFYVLDASLAADPSAINQFLSNASAKAKATNPVIMSVYEAGDSEGVYFYSCEYIPCRSVGQLRESGGTLDETTALAVLKAAGEALDYFAREKLDHDLLTENALLIGPANRVRVANIASNHIALAFDLKAEMRRVGEIVLGVLPPSGAPNARDLAVQLTDPAAAPASWAAFLQILAPHQPKAFITDSYKLDAQERAAIRVVEESKKRQKRGMLINTLVSLALLAAALVAIYVAFLRPKSATVRDLEQMVEVPAGEFIYQDGQKVTLPTFYIDKYEVTIGQYAQFLDFIEKNPDKIAQYEHPDQPKGKSHVPAEWADKKELNPPFPGYYHRAQQWGRYEKAALDVNCPVFGVDWFDAYAYAKWKGHRLPNEQEWEKAARGTDGRKFSWGNNEDPSRANTGADYDRSDPEKGGDKDGFKRWNPVDAKPGDKSPYGMVGASGNVSEWTATIAPSPEGSGKAPVIRGGNWENPDPSVTRRILKLMDLQQAETLGFRTASDTTPAKK